MSIPSPQRIRIWLRLHTTRLLSRQYRGCMSICVDAEGHVSAPDGESRFGTRARRDHRCAYGESTHDAQFASKHVRGALPAVVTVLIIGPCSLSVSSLCILKKA